ncbi:MAG: flavin reductase family protein [Acidimicrobiales bacterium]
MAEHGDLVGPFPSGVDEEAYDRLRRRVLWQLPMGLYLLGSSAGDRKNLMTLNWAMQVSLRPKHLAVSIERNALTHELVLEGGCFALSLLSRDDRAAVRRFVKPAKHDAAAKTLNAMEYTTATTGAPIAGIALGWLDCEVRSELEVGSHTLFVGEVVDAGGQHEAATEVTSAGILRMADTRMSYGG